MSKVSVLHGSSGRKSPAGTATTLILGSIRLASPVYVHAIIAFVEEHWLMVNIIWSSKSKPLLMFIFSHGREHVVSKNEGVLLLIPLSDYSILFLEKLESEIELIFSSKGKTLSLNMSSKLLLELL